MRHENSNDVLIVCKGNICRSPFAAAILRQAYSTLYPGVDFISRSAGTENYHVGKPADPLAIQVASEHGIDLAGHRAQQVSENDVRSASLILVMDEENLARF